MDSASRDSPANQKVAPISWGDPDEVVEFLIDLAKTCREARGVLVRALVRPATYYGPPHVEYRKLLTAFKVADVAGSTVCQERNQDVAAYDRWRVVRETLLSWIRTQLLSGPPALKKDVKQLKRVLHRYFEWKGEVTNIEWKLINEDLELLETKAWEKLPRAAARRGRRLTEHQRRIVAAVELLRQCGVKGGRQMVVEALRSWGVRKQWNTVSNLWSRYKSYPRRHLNREALPEFWLRVIYPFILRQLEPYTSETWPTWIIDRHASGRFAKKLSPL